MAVYEGKNSRARRHLDVVVPTQTIPPAAPSVGQLYWKDGTGGGLQYWNGTAWEGGGSGGARGPEGPQGDPGPPGEQGDPGRNGTDGQKGDKGDQGDPVSRANLLETHKDGLFTIFGRITANGTAMDQAAGFNPTKLGTGDVQISFQPTAMMDTLSVVTATAILDSVDSPITTLPVAVVDDYVSNVVCRIGIFDALDGGAAIDCAFMFTVTGYKA